jgi:hypothetical protein
VAGRGFLNRLAEASGGRVLLPTGRLDSALDGLVDELSSQYVLGFAPAFALPGRTHRLDVRVADRNLKLRYRKSYAVRAADPER